MGPIGINRKKVTLSTSLVDYQNLIRLLSIDHHSASSDEDRDRDDDELENEPVRLSRPSRKSDSHSRESSHVHVLNDREQSQSSTRPSHAAHPTASRPATANNGTRSMNNVSFLSDVSKGLTRPTGVEASGAASTIQLKLVRTLGE